MEQTEFDHPPVDEALISIEFAPLPLSLFELGQIHDRWREEFPVIQEQAALEPSVALGQPGAVPIFGFGTGAPPVRLWFLAPDGHYLIQLQRDRLAVNWRRLESGEYPRYSALRSKFEQVWEGLLEFLSTRGVALGVSVTEFTYINTISPTRLEGELVYAFLRRPDSPVPGTSRFFQYSEVRDLEAGGSTPPGQLTIESMPAMWNGEQIIRLTLTVKFFSGSIPPDATVLGIIDEGHHIARQAFVATTSAAMHEEWGIR